MSLINRNFSLAPQRIINQQLQSIDFSIKNFEQYYAALNKSQGIVDVQIKKKQPGSKSHYLLIAGIVIAGLIFLNKKAEGML